jgi:hypothetical protein
MLAREELGADKLLALFDRDRHATFVEGYLGFGSALDRTRTCGLALRRRCPAVDLGALAHMPVVHGARAPDLIRAPGIVLTSRR